MENITEDEKMYYAHLGYVSACEEIDVYCYFLNRNDIGDYKKRIISLLENNDVGLHREILRREIKPIFEKVNKSLNNKEDSCIIL